MKCESCAMPIESGKYCEHCVDENGNLQTLEERIKRMSMFMKSRKPDLNEEELIVEVKNYLKNMPAWKDHPGL